MGYDSSELSILLTDDNEIKDLNLKYRGKNTPTDVLSFSMNEGEKQTSSSSMLGDVVISVETAARQAYKHGVSLEEEVTRLLIHGLLHLVGYEHENVSEEEARKMEDKERELRDMLTAESVDKRH